MLEKVIKQRVAYYTKGAIEDIESQGIILIYIIKLKETLSKLDISTIYIFSDSNAIESMNSQRELVFILAKQTVYLGR